MIAIPKSTSHRIIIVLLTILTLIGCDERRRIDHPAEPIIEAEQENCTKDIIAAMGFLSQQLPFDKPLLVTCTTNDLLNGHNVSFSSKKTNDLGYVTTNTVAEVEVAVPEMRLTQKCEQYSDLEEESSDVVNAVLTAICYSAKVFQLPSSFWILTEREKNNEYNVFFVKEPQRTVGEHWLVVVTPSEVRLARGL